MKMRLLTKVRLVLYLFIFLITLTIISGCSRLRTLRTDIDYTKNTYLNIVSINFISTAQISDATYLTFLLGMFPGESEYIGLPGISPYEAAIIDFLSKSCEPVYFFEFNHQYQGIPMSVEYTPIEFFEFSHQNLGRHINVVVVISANVKDFQFIEIHSTSSDTQTYHSVGYTLFSIDNLRYNQPFVTSWLQQWHEPVRGISFIDEHDNTRVFTIIENFIGGDVPAWRIVELDEFGELNLAVNFSIPSPPYQTKSGLPVVAAQLSR